MTRFQRTTTPARIRPILLRPLPIALMTTLATAALLAACATGPGNADKAVAGIDTVVVIFAENRAFDNLYGLFPGANGIPGVNPSAIGAYTPQKDFDGTALPALPPVWQGVTVGGQAVTVTQTQTIGMPNRPFRIDAPEGLNGTGIVMPPGVITRDLVHRFYNNQMQIAGGGNDRFAAFSNAGALSMGYYDGSHMQMWALARRYTLADNFFMGAFGGSFLNHQYLICACAPIYPDAANSPARDRISAVDVDAQGRFVRLTPAASAPRSALDGAPRYKHDGSLTPVESDGSAYAINTMQPPFQPSGNKPVAGASPLLADPKASSTLPAQTVPTIADRLDARGIDWAWYGGGWAITSPDTPEARQEMYGGKTNFQPHHQPFNYYLALDPIAHAAARRRHLKDFDAEFMTDAAAGRLPAVTFYKPQGTVDQHAGYTNVADGDAHIARVIEQLQKSPQWAHMLIVVTYDENGGFYDHAAVPKGDRWGPGTRVPAIIVSPLAKKGFVDKTMYDTGSIQRFITRRWQLDPLPGIVERDAALKAHGFVAMGDLSAALEAPH